MPFILRQTEGTRTAGVPTVTGIDGDVVYLGSALTTPAVGDVLEIFNAAGTQLANNGFYTITELLTATTRMRVRPPPWPIASGTTSGQAARLNRANSRTISASTISSIDPLGFDGMAVLTVSGANFIDNNIRPNDRVILTGASTVSMTGNPFVTMVSGTTPTTARAELVRASGSWTDDGFQVGHYLTTGSTKFNNRFMGPVQNITSTVNANDTLVLASGGVFPEVSFLPSAVNVDTDTIAITGHSYVDGNGPVRLVNVSGTLPTGLSTLTDYYVGSINSSTISIYTSAADAIADTFLTISGGGTTITGVNTATEQITFTVPHALSSGSGPFHFSSYGGVGNSLPGGISSGTSYWTIPRDTYNVSIATSRDNALLNVPHNLTSAGTGTVIMTNRVDLVSTGTGLHIMGAKNSTVVATSNVNGAWFVHGPPLDENRIIIRPPDGGVGPKAQTTGGTMAIRFGLHVATISGEPGISFQQLVVSGTMMEAPRPNTYFGSGRARDYFNRAQTGGRRQVLVDGIGAIGIQTHGLSANPLFISTNEVVLSGRPANPGAGFAITTAINSDGAGSLSTDLQIGEGGTDAYSAGNGSAWIGTLVNGAVALKLYASLWDGLGPQYTLSNAGTELIGSIIRNQIILSAGTVESCVFHGVSLLVLGPVAMSNVLLSSQTGVGAAITTPVTMEGLLVSDAFNQTFVNISSGLVVFKNPRADFTIEGVISNNFASSSEKRYTFNPRFVSGAAPGADPLPLENLTVSLYEINETTEVETLVFEGLTDANGRLNSGVGVDLRREVIDGGLPLVTYSHRLVVQGPGVRRINGRLTMTSKVDTDLTIPRLVTNFEEEFDPS